MYWDCALEEEDDRGARRVPRARSRSCSPTRCAGASSATCRSACCSRAASTRGCSRRSPRAPPGRPLRTFTLGFGERRRRRARRRTRGRRRRSAASTTSSCSRATRRCDVLPELLAAYDEPGQSLVQNHVISRFARTGVTVALSGVGGDELFAAYPTHVVATCWRASTASRGRCAARLAGAARMAPVARVRRAAQLAAMDSDGRVSQRAAAPDAAPRCAAALLAPDVRAHGRPRRPGAHLEEQFARTRGARPAEPPAVRLHQDVPLQRAAARDRRDEHAALARGAHAVSRLPARRAARCACRRSTRCACATGKLVLREIAARTLAGAARPREARVRAAASRRGCASPAGERRARGAVRAGGALARRSSIPQAVARRARALPRRRRAHGAAGDDALQLRDLGAALARRPAPASRRAARPVELRSAPAAALSVIVVNWNTREILRDCLSSLAAPSRRRRPRGDRRRQRLERRQRGHGRGRLPAGAADAQRREHGFAAANNQAMRGRSRRLAAAAQQRHAARRRLGRAPVRERARRAGDVAVAQCRLLLPDGRLQHSALPLPERCAWRCSRTSACTSCSAAGGRRARCSAATGTTTTSATWTGSPAPSCCCRARSSSRRAASTSDLHVRRGHRVVLAHPRRRRRIRFFPEADDRPSRPFERGDALRRRARRAVPARASTTSSASATARARATLFMALRLTGAGARVGWYTARAAARRPAAEAIATCSRSSSANFRTLRATGGAAPMSWSLPRGPAPGHPGARRAARAPLPRRRLRRGRARRGAAAGRGRRARGRHRARPAAAAARARERLDVVVEGSVLDAPLPFAAGEFDLIVFADVLEHLPDPDAALARCLPLPRARRARSSSACRTCASTSCSRG